MICEHLRAGTQQREETFTYFLWFYDKKILHFLQIIICKKEISSFPEKTKNVIYDEKSVMLKIWPSGKKSIDKT